VNIEMNAAEVEWSFIRDWRLEGLPDGGIDGRDYALRRGHVVQDSNETCSACHVLLKVSDSVVVHIEGYRESGFYAETYYHFPACLPERYSVL